MKIALDYQEKNDWLLGVLRILNTFGNKNQTWLFVKIVEKMLDILSTFWEKIDIDYWRGGAKVLRICGTFWDKNHNWLSAKKFDIISAYLEKTKGSLDHLWHFFGVTLFWHYRRINQKRELLALFGIKITLYYWLSWAFVALFGIKMTIDYRLFGGGRG